MDINIQVWERIKIITKSQITQYSLTTVIPKNTRTQFITEWLIKQTVTTDPVQ